MNSSLLYGAQVKRIFKLEGAQVKRIFKLELKNHLVG